MTAIVKVDVYSYIKKAHQYAKKNDLVTVTNINEHVAICVKENGEWFPVNIKKLTIVP